MSDEVKDGGQAYPARVWDEDGTSWCDMPGMSVRDYFAGQAIVLFPLTRGDVLNMENGGLPDHEAVAHFCYSLADAMLEARKK